MTATRPELTPEHREMFRAFVRLVYEMDQCRFIRKYREQDHTVSCGPDADGEAKTTAPDYDWDDFRSFMAIFRKVGIAVKEPTYLAKIYKLMGRYTSDALRKRFGADRPKVMAMLEGTWTGMQVGGTIDGKVSATADMAILAGAIGRRSPDQPGRKNVADGISRG